MDVVEVASDEVSLAEAVTFLGADIAVATGEEVMVASHHTNLRASLGTRDSPLFLWPNNLGRPLLSPYVLPKEDVTENAI